jgi:hypothetical protein
MRTTWFSIALCIALFCWASSSQKLTGEAKPPPPCQDCSEPLPDAGNEDASSDAGNHDAGAAVDASTIETADAVAAVPSSDAGASAGTSDAAAASGASNPGGCSCDLVGRRPVSPPLGSGLALLAWVTFRRRRHSPSR